VETLFHKVEETFHLLIFKITTTYILVVSLAIPQVDFLECL